MMCSLNSENGIIKESVGLCVSYGRSFNTHIGDLFGRMSMGVSIDIDLNIKRIVADFARIDSETRFNRKWIIDWNQNLPIHIDIGLFDRNSTIFRNTQLRQEDENAENDGEIFKLYSDSHGNVINSDSLTGRRLVVRVGVNRLDDIISFDSAVLDIDRRKVDRKSRLLDFRDNPITENQVSIVIPPFWLRYT